MTDRARIARVLEERFEAKVMPEPNSGCWLWVGSWNQDGYGGIAVPGRGHERAHRVSWEIAHGSIPLGLMVLHSCDTPPCVNPAHLFLGTQLHNMRDAAKKGRINTAGLSRRNDRLARLTECWRGHPFSGDNLIVRHGNRFCRACGQINHANSQRRKNERRQMSAV